MTATLARAPRVVRHETAAVADRADAAAELAGPRVVGSGSSTPDHRFGWEVPVEYGGPPPSKFRRSVGVAKAATNRARRAAWPLNLRLQSSANPRRPRWGVRLVAFDQPTARPAGCAAGAAWGAPWREQFR